MFVRCGSAVCRRCAKEGLPRLDAPAGARSGQHAVVRAVPHRPGVDAGGGRALLAVHPARPPRRARNGKDARSDGGPRGGAGGGRAAGRDRAGRGRSGGVPAGADGRQRRRHHLHRHLHQLRHRGHVPPPLAGSQRARTRQRTGRAGGGGRRRHLQEASSDALPLHAAPCCGCESPSPARGLLGARARARRHQRVRHAARVGRV
mmetsp:Transcript_14782/g.35694  ORF Transcript_14782/g.35694 Transcript_14782/m.35694 type:complete len:204 (-) Transcript_14782:334-945(-)